MVGLQIFINSYLNSLLALIFYLSLIICLINSCKNFCDYKLSQTVNLQILALDTPFVNYGTIFLRIL